MPLTNKLKTSHFVRLESETVASSPTISFRGKSIAIVLYVITALLLAASAAGDYLWEKYSIQNHFVERYIDFFYLSKENNLPTLFSVLLLLSVSGLCFLIFKITAQEKGHKGMRVYWLALSLMFIFLGLDEGLQIHDRISHVKPVEAISKESSFFYYGWAVPYAIGVLITGFLFLRFLFSLPLKVRRRFIIAGVIYVTGALGFEFIESWAHVQYGKDGILERTLCTVEETLEMVGAILFIHALLDYIGSSKAWFSFSRPETQPKLSASA